MVIYHIITLGITIINFIPITLIASFLSFSKSAAACVHFVKLSNILAPQCASLAPHVHTNYYFVIIMITLIMITIYCYDNIILFHSVPHRAPSIDHYMN